MIIQGLSPIAAPKPRVAPSERVSGPERIAAKKAGTAPESERAELLDSIRRRVSGGFYNSDAVLDDLSSSFATVFNEIS